MSKIFPDSEIVAVLDSFIAYVDVGEGETILFLHGNPSWSFQWRNVIPSLATRYRCIAVDLIGMGRSGKPDISYSFDDHALYLSGFVKALALKNVTLVLHDWGIALGLDLARRHQGLAAAVALVARGEDLTEGVLASVASWDDLSPEARQVFEAYWSEDGPELVLEQNHFLEVLMPANMMKALTEEEMACYREPFPDRDARAPILAFNRQVPIAGQPPGMSERIADATRWLIDAACPTLLLHASPDPGRPLLMVDWARECLADVVTVDVGTCLHYLTEDRPAEIAAALAHWLPNACTRAKSGMSAERA